MSNASDLVGRKFGYLTVLSRAENDKQNKTQWRCQCDCGNVVTKKIRNLRESKNIDCGCNIRLQLEEEKIYNYLQVIGPSNKKGKRSQTYTYCLCTRCGNICCKPTTLIKNNKIKSCGCLEQDNLNKIKGANKTHGKSSSNIYFIWTSMLERCEKDYSTRYKNYGGRGIKVCDEWHDFNIFYKWIKDNGYKKGMSVERVNNDGNYSPENCILIPRSHQARNTSRSKKITYQGKTLTISEWSRIFNINADTIRYRYNKGFSIDKIFFKGKIKDNHKCPVKLYNKEDTKIFSSSVDAAKYLKISETTLANHFKNKTKCIGWNIEYIEAEVGKNLASMKEVTI